MALSDTDSTALRTAYEDIFGGMLDCFPAEYLQFSDWAFTADTTGITADDTTTVDQESQQYACSGDELNETNEVEFGGVVDMPSVVITIKKSLLPSVPRRGANAIYTKAGRSIRMKIGSVRSGSSDTLLLLDMMPVDKGRRGR